VDAERSQRVADLFQLEGFDDRDNEFHGFEIPFAGLGKPADAAARAGIRKRQAG
jgi:hypothetical protein